MPAGQPASAEPAPAAQPASADPMPAAQPSSADPMPTAHPISDTRVRISQTLGSDTPELPHLLHVWQGLHTFSKIPTAALPEFLLQPFASVAPKPCGLYTHSEFNNSTGDNSLSSRGFLGNSKVSFKLFPDLYIIPATLGVLGDPGRVTNAWVAIKMQSSF